MLLYLHRKQLRPVIIQSTSYDYKKKDKSPQNYKVYFNFERKWQQSSYNQKLFTQINKNVQPNGTYIKNYNFERKENSFKMCNYEKNSNILRYRIYNKSSNNGKKEMVEIETQIMIKK